MVKKRTQTILLALAAVLCLYFLYQHFFPNEPRLIQKRLAALADCVSVSENPSAVANLAAGERLRDFFTSDLQVEVDVPASGRVTLSGRAEIIEAALAMRAQLGGLKAQFLDVNVTVEAGGQTATAHLTARATRPGDPDFFVQEMKLRLRKDEGRWRVFRVETIRTLKL
jgi:hypothetical protein